MDMNNFKKNFANEPQTNPFDHARSRRGDAYANPNNGAVQGTRDYEVFQEAISHQFRGLNGTTQGAKNNNLV